MSVFVSKFEQNKSRISDLGHSKKPVDQPQIHPPKLPQIFFL